MNFTNMQNWRTMKLIGLGTLPLTITHYSTNQRLIRQKNQCRVTPLDKSSWLPLRPEAQKCLRKNGSSTELNLKTETTTSVLTSRGLRKLIKNGRKTRGLMTRQSQLSKLILMGGLCTILFTGVGSLTKPPPRYFRQLISTDQYPSELNVALLDKPLCHHYMI